MSDYVLVLGGSSDPQLKLVLKHLEALGTPFRFIDHEATTPFHLALSDDGALSLTIDGVEVPEPTLLWTRLKVALLLGDWSENSAEEYLRRSEWIGCLGAIALHFDNRALYSLTASWRAEYKIEQLAKAARAGFCVPRSDFFLGKDIALSLAHGADPRVAKVFQTIAIPKLGGNTEEYRMLGVMDVTSEQINEADAAEFSSAPSFFQTRIRTGSELRVIVIGEHVHCYRHINDVEERERADERRLLFGEVRGRPLHAMLYRHVPTPAFLAEAAPALLRDLGLVYGALDIIETEDGYFFLEVNPEGQWFAASHFNIEDLGRQFAEILSKALRERSGSTASAHATIAAE